MSWPARSSLSGGFASLLGGGGGDVALESGSVVVRVRGKSQRFELTAPDARVSLHHWAPIRGAVLRFGQGDATIDIGGERYASPESAYAPDAVARPDLILSRPHFEALHRGVREATGLAGAADVAGPARFVLYRNGGHPLWAFRPGVTAMALVAVAAMSLGLLPVPLSVILVGVVFGAFILGERHVARLMREGAIELEVAGGALLITRANAPGAPERWTIDRQRVRFSRWQPLTSRAASGALDLPAVRVELRPGVVLSIGSVEPSADATGPVETAPRYVLDPAWWPLLVKALLPAQ